MVAIGINCIWFIPLLSAVSASYLSESYILQKFQEWQKQVEQQEIKNERCYAQIVELLQLLENSAVLEDNWAWRMIDAANKINAGILTGNAIGTGNMDECLAIDEMHEDMEVKGKYCYAAINLPLPEKKENRIRQFSNRASMVHMPGFYSAAICIPHECKMVDFIPEMGETDACQTTDTLKDLDRGDWAFIIFLIVIGVICIISSFYDWYIRYNKQKALYPITLAFSFYTNSEKILKINNDPDQFNSLNGIRALSMLWVMLGHRFSSSLGAPMVNVEYAKEWTEKPYSQYIQGAPVAVDSFFFLTGVLIAYGFMKSQSIPKARFNIILYYVHRYLRLTPAAAVLYFYYVTIFKHVTTGPIWPLMVQFQQETCLNNAVSYFLYIQNIINPEIQCSGQTWYLSVDFQIFLFSPIILLPMVKFPKYAGYALVGLILLSILPPALITYYMEILLYAENFMKHYYAQPYTRISPWLVGVLLGYLLYQLRDKKVKINWIINLCTWILVLIGMGFILYIGNEMALSEDIPKIAVYNGLHRLLWAVGLMWIVFACHYGYGGIINYLLTMPVFQVLGRLSYSMYLLHVSVQMMSVYGKKTPFYFDDYELVNQAFGDMVTVTFLAFFYCMMFESPILVIEKIIFAPKGKIVRGMDAVVNKFIGTRKATQGDLLGSLTKLPKVLEKTDSIPNDVEIQNAEIVASTRERDWPGILVTVPQEPEITDSISNDSGMSAFDVADQEILPSVDIVTEKPVHLRQDSEKAIDLQNPVSSVSVP